MDNNYLVHHGVKGMKWGVRRYQNPDGTRTRLGKIHDKTSSPEFKAKAKTAAKVAAAGALLTVGGLSVAKAAKSPLVKKGIQASKKIAKESGKQFVSGLPNTISNAGKDALKVALTGSMIYAYERHLDRKYGDNDTSKKIIGYGRQPQKKK